jgi:hypothetical protein
MVAEYGLRIIMTEKGEQHLHSVYHYYPNNHRKFMK